MEGETLVYLEYLPQHHLHRVGSKNQHLKILCSKKRYYKMEKLPYFIEPGVTCDKLCLSTLGTEGLWDVTDIIYLQRIHGNLFGAIIDELELSAFV